MKNKYKITNHYVIIFFINKKNQNFEILIDKKDFNKVKNNSWCVVQKRNRFYAKANINLGNKKFKHQYIHQKILNYNTIKFTCDHINLNGLDNRKQNLRICTNQQNNWNKPLTKQNKSGIIGVHFIKRLGKWCAQIKLNKKTKHLGIFKDIDEAIKIRKNAEQKYRGEFAYNENSNSV